MILESLFIAITMWVYIHITSEPDMIMNGFYLKLDSWTRKVSKLNKLVSCEYCLSGFTMLWAYPFITDDYNLFWHIGYISLTIFFIHIFNTFLRDEED